MDHAQSEGWRWWGQSLMGTQVTPFTAHGSHRRGITSSDACYTRFYKVSLAAFTWALLIQLPVDSTENRWWHSGICMANLRKSFKLHFFMFVNSDFLTWLKMNIDFTNIIEIHTTWHCAFTWHSIKSICWVNLTMIGLLRCIYTPYLAFI